MDLRNAERYLEHTLQITQKLYDKHVEQELTLDGFSRRLSQMADTMYLGFIILSFPVCMYSLDRALSLDSEQPTSLHQSHWENTKSSLDHMLVNTRK